MTRFERFVVNIARWFSPSLEALHRTAGGAQEALVKLREAEWIQRAHRDQSMSFIHEMKEAEAMYAGPQAMTMAESSKALGLKESMGFTELELALEDRGWQREDALSKLQFSTWGIHSLIKSNRLAWIKNPLIKRGINVSSIYVFGRGVTISSETPAVNDVIQRFLKANAKELGHRGLVEKDEALATDGNLYFVFFSSDADGETKIRTIDPLEILEKICNPEDASEDWYFLRSWTQNNFNTDTGRIEPKLMWTWHPAINFDPSEKPVEMRGYSVAWDRPVYHVKDGGNPKWTFGVPKSYAAQDWARAVKSNLEDWASITRAHARFAWNVETQGGTQAIQNFSDVLSTTLGNGGAGIETNPPAVVGSTFVTGPGNKLTPIKTAGASTSPEEGRRLLLMVAAAFGLPESFFGDVQVGSLATAQSLDRPTELMMLAQQEVWREIIQTILEFVLGKSITTPKGRLKEAGIRVVEMAQKITHIQPNGTVVRVWEAKKPETGTALVKVDFPSVLEHDIGGRVSAIVEAATFNGFEVTGIDEKVAVEALYNELGIENAHELTEEQYPDAEYDPDRTAEEDPALAVAAPGAVPGTPAAQNPANQRGVPPNPPKERKPKAKRSSVPHKEAAEIASMRRDFIRLREQILAK